MKKGLALCMTAVLAMGCLLTGCGSSDTGAKSTTGSAAAGTEAAGTETAGTEAAGTRQQTVKRKHLLLVLMPASRHMVIRRMASMSVLIWIWHRKSVTEMVGNL